MRYKFNPQILNKQERETLNEQILEAIKNGEQVKPDYIFNHFTGLGGLHKLDIRDFPNFAAYTLAKKDAELGQFFTPPQLCEAIVKSLQPSEDLQIADLSCGSGNFFNYLPNERNLYGIELDPNAHAVAKKLYPKATIVMGDFTEVVPTSDFDMIIGNPPFNLRTPLGLSQWAFVLQAKKYLKAGGLLCFICPKTFLEDDFMSSKKREELAKDFDFLYQAELKNYFDVAIDIKVMYFRKHGLNPAFLPYQNVYRDFDPKTIFNELVAPVWKENSRDHAKLRLKDLEAIGGDHHFRIKKLLFELKTHPHLRQFLEEANARLLTLRTQEQPANMDWKDWDKIREKPEQLLRWMQRKVNNQNRKAPVNVVKLVKQQYNFKHKAYSKKLAGEQRTEPVYSMVCEGKLPTGFVRLMRKKRADYLIQQTKFSDLERVPKLDKFLRNFELTDRANGVSFFEEPTSVKLNDKQFHDLGLSFQKKYTMLNWQQGGGKSVAGMAWMKYIDKKVHNIFLTAPSLAAHNTWNVRLEQYGFKYIFIQEAADLKKIKKGQIVLISFDMVRIHNRLLREYIKKVCAYKIALLVDESDELTNINSERTQAMLKAFRRAKYKLLTTGTTTRNNINELYPQLALLYNNSVNMMNWCESIYKVDKDGGISREKNESYYGKPFPARRGQGVFRDCFSPRKTTVFGVKQDNQDVYNADQIKHIIEVTMITRKFKDIVGKNLYTIKTHQILQSAAERDLYKVIVEEFMSIMYKYYENTGNTRKEASLRLIRQLGLLIESTSIPHLLDDYQGGAELPHKFYKARDLCKEWANEKVAIGTVRIEAATEYVKYLSKWLPDRKIFYVDGGKSFGQRKRIVDQFQATKNGILVSTMMSLKSSVDIETCNRCIVESLLWNFPKMEQYFFRFIRYTSKEHTEVHFINYADTIEVNILALLMSKEKVNSFVKSLEMQSREDIYEEFDLDIGILDSIIEKTYDSEGKMHLSWGTQKIVS